MKFLHNRNYRQEIEQLFENDEELDIAIAFFGKDALSFFKKTRKKIRIICNLESGACNPNLIEEVGKLDNITIKTNSKLHAKILIQKSTVLIGSANMSANGLSLEGKEIEGWFEAGILTSDENIINNSQEWFKHL